MKRVVTALLLIPAVVGIVYFGPVWLLLAVVATVAAFCFHEYSGIVAGHGIQPPGPAGFGIGLILLVIRQNEALIITLAAMLAMILALRSADLAKALPRSAAMMFGVIYIFGAWRCAVLLRAADPSWLMLALGLNWVGDTTAYFAGRAFGRHLLATRVSPSKTWEGAIASLIGAVVFGVILLNRAQPQVPVAESAALSAVACIAGQIGDLAESAFKRGAKLKDSGTMLPGHGGWLDRVDSSLFSLPIVYLYVSRPW